MFHVTHFMDQLMPAQNTNSKTKSFFNNGYIEIQMYDYLKKTKQTSYI